MLSAFQNGLSQKHHLVLAIFWQTTLNKWCYLTFKTAFPKSTIHLQPIRTRAQRATLGPKNRSSHLFYIKVYYRGLSKNETGQRRAQNCYKLSKKINSKTEIWEFLKSLGIQFLVTRLDFQQWKSRHFSGYISAKNRSSKWAITVDSNFTSFSETRFFLTCLKMVVLLYQNMAKRSNTPLPLEHLEILSIIFILLKWSLLM